MSKGLHKGHRQRMKAKYLKDNFDNMNNHEALEMLLYYAYPQIDTNPRAHELIEHFGSLSSVFDASVSSLRDFGLSDNAAILLKFIPDFARLYLNDKQEFRSKNIDPDDFCDYFKDKFVGRTEEMMYCLLLDGNFNQLHCELISKGSINSTDVPIRRIVELTLLYKARFVAVAHNHPLGMAIPSKADIDATKVIYDTLSGVNAVLLDHIIVSATEQLSLANSTFGSHIF